MAKQPKRKVKQNVWGNWNGYEGGRKVQEFGTDDVSAGYWLETGIVDSWAGYDSQESIAQLRNLAFQSSN